MDHKNRGGETRRTHLGNNLVLIIAFAAVVVLMVLVVSVGLSSMSAINGRLELIVHNYNVKRALVETMYLTARERVYGLQKMLIIDDPFQRDSESVQIDNAGAEFSVARRSLMAMELTADEALLLDEQGLLATQAVPVQREVARLIIEERIAEARDMLMDEAIPLQEGVLEILAQLGNLQRQAAQEASAEALAAQARARRLMLSLGGGALFLAVGIAGFTVRRVRRAEHNLATEKERAEITLYAIGDGVITCAVDGSIEYLNPAAERLTGWSGVEARGQPLLAVFRLWDERTRVPTVHSAPQLLETSSAGVVLARRDERTLAVEFTASTLPAPNGQQDGIVVVFRDVSEMRALAEQLHYQARHDALTGLINRREFEHRLENALESARLEGRHHVLCYIDLDRFKAVNDTCGHAAGDELLKQLTRELKAPIRENDAMARLGGDEFGVLLENCPLEKAVAIAEALRQRVGAFQFVWEDKAFQVGASIGLVEVDRDCGGLADAMAAADTACYLAKEHGRDRVHLFRREDHDDLACEDKAPWADRLRRAIEQDRFDLYVQPVVPLTAHDCQSRFEVLLRLVEGGREVLPSAFLPAAERAGLMQSIDRWVVRHLVEWLDGRADDGSSYSINISAQSLCDDAFVDATLDLFQQYRVDPARICFELAETAVVTNLSAARNFIERFRDYGCRMVLDEFGSGLTSFAYLKHLNIDSLKISGSLILSLDSDPMNSAIVEAIHRISHVLGIRTVAKFVESPQALERLRGIGIDYAQGYGVAAPRPLMAPVALAASG